MALGAFAGGLAGGTIGAVAVQLIADSSRLNRGLSSAKKNTASAATVMERRAANVRAAWTGMAIVAGAALIKFGISAVKSAREAEVAQANLQNTLENMPKLAGANIQAFNDQAAALQDLTGVSDEAITMAQSMLGTFGLTKQQLLEATPVVADYAAKFGVDLKSAAIQVGKAFDGNIGALKRNGISLDELAFKADPVKETLRAIREQAGGFAEQQGKTFSKRVEILKQNFDDLKESIGRMLLNALEPTLKIISALMDGFNSLPGPIKATIGVVGGLTLAITLLGGAIGMVSRALVAIRTAAVTVGSFLAAFATGPVALIIASLTSLYLVITNIGSAFKGISESEAFKEKFGGVKEGADLTTEALQTSAEGFEDWKGSAAEGIHDVSSLFTELSANANLTTGDIIKAFNKQNRAIRDYEKNLQTVKDRGLPAELTDQLEDMGLAAAPILEALAASHEKSFNRTATSILKAMGLTDRHIANLLRIPRSIHTTVSFDSGNVPDSRRDAAGFHGVVRKPQWHLVGEAGPERVDVTPLAQLRRGMNAPASSAGWAGSAAGGGVNIYAPIHVHGDIHGDEFARKVEAALTRSVSRFAGV